MSIKDFGSKKILDPKNILGPKKCRYKNFWVQIILGQIIYFELQKFGFEELRIQKSYWINKMLGPKKFWGGGGKTVGTSSLDYRKPTYQILASYYA